MGQFDGAIKCGLDRGQVRRDWACPSDGDAREGFGDEEAVPGAELPGAVGVWVADADGGVDELSELGDARLGDHGGAAGAIGSDSAVVAGEVGALKVAQARGAVPGAGAANGKEAHSFGGAGDQFPIEAAAYEDRKTVVAEGPYAGKHAAMPEGVDGRSGNIEADGSAGFADVLVAESGA